MTLAQIALYVVFLSQTASHFVAFIFLLAASSGSVIVAERSA